MTLFVILAVFALLQALANIAFKYGSGTSGIRSTKWLVGFVGGNVVGSISILLLMQVYSLYPHNSNLANVIGGSVAFLASQLGVALCFRERLAPRQWAGVAIVAAGTTIAAMAAHGG